jgi:hypothetical protein
VAKPFGHGNSDTHGFWLRHQDGDIVLVPAMDVDVLHVSDWYN